MTHVRADGTPDFRVHDVVRREQCAEEDLCQLCGTSLGETMVFVGREESARRGVFGEPPMHPECWEYARAVCPWVQGRPHSSRPGDAETRFLERAQDPHWLRVYTTTGYTRIAGGRFLAHAPVGEVLWLERPLSS